MNVWVKVLVNKVGAPVLRDESTKNLKMSFSYARKAWKTRECRVVPPGTAKSKRDVKTLRNIEKTAVECTVVIQTFNFNVIAQ